MQSIDLGAVQGIIRWLKGGHQLSLITVVNTWDPSLRPVGSIHGIRQYGLLLDSVSGGCIEDDVVKAFTPKQHTEIVSLSHDPRLGDMALLEALIFDAFYESAIESHSNNQKRRERMAMLTGRADDIKDEAA
ncbi:MAG: XdhC family protein [Gammaproteobacteria bacterium]|nr:XdhC family protein [Gammaproteobacteria bacterium]